MTLIKTSVLTAISTIITVISAFIINKVLAVYVGPSGLALVGQLKDFVTIITTFSNGAISQGIVKYTAEYETIEEKQKVFSTSIIISLVCSTIISVLLFILSDYLSVKILKDSQYSGVFIVFGLTVFLFALNVILMSILNGQKEIKKYVLANIANSLVALFVTSILIFQLNIIGALYALVINQSVVFFITLLFVMKSNWFKIVYFKQGIDKETLVKLIKYSFMAITSVLTVTISQIIIRNYIGENLGWDSAGYWQGIYYISSIYLMIITTSLSVYYLPKLSSIKDKIELKKEILNGYKIIIPIVIILASFIYFIKEYVIIIAFDEKFMPMIELFKWQLIGDVIKIASWLLSYLMLAKALTKYFIFTEIFFSFTWIGLTLLMIEKFGLIGSTYAFTINYLLYLIGVYIIIKKEIFNEK
ncbi:O-antigen translocase [Aliarcobacter cryaerophilus]|uniref:O-antigen translocase n=1 Tax=Aliarcobacter cryaerophilus TaxID=28198 RepID=UPI003DA33B6A